MYLTLLGYHVGDRTKTLRNGVSHPTAEANDSTQCRLRFGTVVENVPGRKNGNQRRHPDVVLQIKVSFQMQLPVS